MVAFIAVLALVACEVVAGIEEGQPLQDSGAVADVAAGGAASGGSAGSAASAGSAGDSGLTDAISDVREPDGTAPEVVPCNPDCGCNFEAVAGAEAQTFKDLLPGAFGADAADKLHAAGILDGCQLDPLLFCPTCYMSRAALVKWVVLVAKLPLVTPAKASFIDVSLNHPYFAYIETAVANGIATGYPNLEFRPNYHIPRNSAAIWVARARGLPTPSPLKQTYTDVTPGSWAHESIEALHAACVTTGCKPGPQFCPVDPLTRRDAAMWVARAFDYVPSACE